MTRRGAARRDRGQLLLAGSVAIAVVFIGLVVVLNAGLYTANVSPRAGVDSATDAGSTVDSARRDVGGLIVASSYRVVDGRTYLTPERLARNVTSYEAYYGAAVVSSGPGAVTVSLNETTNGSRSLVAQTDETRAFTSPGTDDPNWTVVSDADELGAFNVTIGSFPVHQAQNATARIVVDDGIDRWRLSAYWDNPSNEAHVRVVEPDGSVTDCVFPQSGRNDDSGVRVDVSGGKIHAPCGDDTFRSPGETLSGDYDLTFIHDGPGNTDRITGTYGFVTDGDPHDGFAAEPGSTPFVVPELESATVDVSFYSPSVDAETTVTVAPNDGLPFAFASSAKTGFDTVPGTTPESGGLVDGTGLFPGGMTFLANASGNVSSLSEDGQAVQTYDATDAVALGPQRADFDGDGYADAAFVDGSNGLRLVDGNDAGARTLAPGVASHRFAVTDWNGDVSAFYATSSGRIGRADADGSSAVADADADAASVAGAGDVDGDGDEELVFVGTDGDIRYLETDGSVTDTGRSVADADAVGRPFDADGDGVDEVPFVDADGEVALYGDDGVDDFASTAGARAASLAVLDVDLDGEAEIVYVGSDDHLVALDISERTTSELSDENGDPVAADGSAGAA